MKQCSSDCEAAEALRQLRAAIHRERAFDLRLKLSPAQARGLALLYKRSICTKQALESVIVANPDMSDVPGDVVKVHISHIRRKLRPFNIEIITCWGHGYALKPEHKEKLKPLIVSI